MSRQKGKTQYITIVRDLETGAVLYVVKGKGFEAMVSSTSRLKRSGAKIEIIHIMGREELAESPDSFRSLPSDKNDEEYFHLKIFDLPKMNIKLKL